jgi:hypothetical protein
MLATGHIIKIPVKTILIGVDLTEEDAKLLALMHLLGGDNTELFNVQNYDVGKIFEKIRISLGLMRQVSAVNIKVARCWRNWNCTDLE